MSTRGQESGIGTPLLRIDPADLDAEDSIVDTLDNMHVCDKLRTHKAIINRREGADRTADLHNAKTTPPEAISGCGTGV